MDCRKLRKKTLTSAAIFLSCLMLINTSQPILTVSAADQDDNQHFFAEVDDSFKEASQEAEKSGTCGEGISWALSSAGLLTITGTGKLDDNIISGKNIPWLDLKDEIKELMIGNGVRNIGGFSDCVNLEKITFGNSIEVIESNAFSGCTAIKSVIIPASVSSVGSKAFFNCRSLDSLSLQEGVTSFGSYAFSGCTRLEEVSIPKTVSLIGEHAFGYTSGSPESKNTSFTISGYKDSAASNYASSCGFRFIILDPVNIPEGSLGDSIHWEISDDTLKITGSGKINDFTSASAAPWAEYLSGGHFSKLSVGNGITSIGNFAFHGMSGVESVSVADSVKRIGCYAFEGSTVKSVTLPSEAETIDIGAFKNCKGLTSVLFGGKINAIGESAFEGCTSLETVTIPYGSASTIGPRAFSGCTALGSVSLSDSVKLIENEAFSGCSKLKNINFPAFLESIGAKAFYECKSLSSISIGGTVKAIGSQAFFGCTSLKTVTLESGIAEISDYAFSGCSAISGISIPDSVSSVGEGAFYNCTGITHVSIGTGVKGIAPKTFEGCTSLKDVNLSEGLETISECSFTSCTSLKEITIPQSVYSMELHSVGYSCTSINGSNSYAQYADFIIKGYHPSAAETYAAAYGFTFASTGSVGAASGTFGNGLTWEIKVTSGTFKVSGNGAIPDFNSADDVPWAFYSSVIQNVIIERGITGIGAYAFAGASDISSVSFPTTLKSIGFSAFRDCKSIETIEFPSSLTDIGEYAFSGCSSLESVRMSENLKNIGSHAFFGCEALTSMTIPEGVEQIGDYAVGYISEEAKSSITVYGYSQSAAEDYAGKNKLNFVISGSLVIKNTQTGVQISFAENENTLNYEFKVSEIKPEDYIHYIMVGQSHKIAIYMTSIIRLGEVISPENPFELSVPVPEGADPEKCQIYHINGDGTFTKLQSSEADNQLTFKSPDMLDFVITDADLTTIYTAKIDYLYDSGSSASNPIEINCSAGAEFDVESPEIAGFIPSESKIHVSVYDGNVSYTVKYSKNTAISGLDSSNGSIMSESKHGPKYALLLTIEIIVLVMTVAAAGLIIWMYIKKRKGAVAAAGADNGSAGSQTIVIDSTKTMQSSDSTTLYGALSGLADAGQDISYDDDLELDDSQFDSMPDDTGNRDETSDGSDNESDESRSDGGDDNDGDDDIKIAAGKDGTVSSDTNDYDVKIFSGSAGISSSGKVNNPGFAGTEDTIVIDIIEYGSAGNNEDKENKK